MRLIIPEVLPKAALEQVRELLAPSQAWTDGTATSGTQSRQVKNNQQTPENGEHTAAARAIVVAHLARHPLFVMAALPRRLYPPNFNRYAASANAFGNHIDNALRALPAHAGHLRTDLSCTLFLSSPASYDGGELVIEQAGGASSHKLNAGDMLLYQASTVHRVNAVTRGERLACFFWVESLIRSAEQRELLYQLDLNLMRLRELHGETPEIVAITATYHNLLRLWAET